MRVRAGIIGAVLTFLLAGWVAGAAPANPALERTLRQLPRLGTIAYVTAHPDDESAAIITYLARGLHARVVILCLTRGEGGQNLTGPELGEELGRVRTRELEQAAAGYGAEVRFIGAEDFGYSKSLEETLGRWDAEAILGELVRQIRTLRPLVVISHWATEEARAGAHHQAAGVLTRRAFALAGDAQAFPEQIVHGLRPWQPRYLLVRTYKPDEEGSFAVPVKQVSLVAGKSYEELGWEAFQNHRSQGLDRVKLSEVGFLRRYYLRVEATLRRGPPAPVSAVELAPDLAALPDFFPAVPVLGRWRTRLAQVVSLAEKAYRLLKEDKPEEAALALVQGAGLLTALRREIPPVEADRETNSVRALLDVRQNEFLEAAAALGGVELEALSDRATVTPGERVWVGLAARVEAPAVFRAAGFEFGTMRLVAPIDWPVEPVVAGRAPGEQRAEFIVRIPAKVDPRQVGATPLRGRAALTTGSLRLELESPVHGLARRGEEPAGFLERLDPRRLLGSRAEERRRATAQLEPVSVAPAVTLELEPRRRLLPATAGETTREWCVQLEAHRPEFGKISVWFDVPVGWYTPLPQETELRPAGARANLCFPLTLPRRIAPGRYELQAVAGRGSETFRLARRARFRGPGALEVVYEPARAQVDVLDIRVPAGLKVGYIGFNDDPVPALLAPLGIGVDRLDVQTLATAALDDYDAILIATRAYDYRSDLAAETPRLLDYVKAGGTLVVEHQGRRWDPGRFAPYPAAKPANGNLRVTDETAAVRVLAKQDPLLNFPNAIGEDDWKDWRQERGLYFWESWSEEYTPVVELADPGEEPQRGALLWARYGDGVYIYCGLALFRQVRAGVPGGVRLYVNLLSQRRARPQ